MNNDGTKLTAADFPAHHPEWVQRDHMLIAWAMFSSLRWRMKRLGTGAEITHFTCNNISVYVVHLDPFGLPILTPELRQRLGDEWRKWKESQP